MVVPGESSSSASEPEHAQSDASRSELFFRWGAALLVAGVVIAAGALVFHLVGEARASERKTRFKNSMKQLGIYFALYESRYKSYPADEQSLKLWAKTQAIDLASLLACPACGHEIAFVPGGVEPPVTGVHDGAPIDSPLAWHACPKTGMTQVLFFQGRVDEFAEWTPPTVRK
jgi:hypothetical protein